MPMAGPRQHLEAAAEPGVEVGGSHDGGGASAGGGAGGSLSQAGAPAVPSPELHFDTTISRDVLERYLSRSISFTELLHDDLAAPRNLRGVDPHDNFRLLIESKAKFVGRALMLWGSEQNLATPRQPSVSCGEPDRSARATVRTGTASSNLHSKSNGRVAAALLP
jgi:hypothetical protein